MPHLLQRQPLGGIAFHPVQRSSSSVQNGRSVSIKRWRSMIMVPGLEQLSLFHAEILRNKLHAQLLVFQQVERHAAPVQHTFSSSRKLCQRRWPPRCR